jgi:site-specific recombinase XerD
MNQALTTTTTAGALASERIDPQRLRANFEKFKANETSSNTRKTYASQWHTFQEWCKKNGLPALPAEAVTLAAYIEHLYNAGKQRSTIDIARAAIKWHHLDAGHANPFSDVDLEKMYSGVVRTLADEGRTTPKVKPTINLEDLRAMSRACGDTLIGLRDRALILVAYAGWMRRAEPLKLRVEAMEWHADYVRCWLGATKTDQTGANNEYITVPKIDDAELCGYRALRAWLDASGITAGAVFVKITYGKLTKVALGRDNYINEIVERIALRAGLDAGRIAPHRAFRASPITAAVHADENLALISKRARHKSFETTKKYIDRNAGDDVRVGRAAY